jgi:opacity protein-like surface antigen
MKKYLIAATLAVIAASPALAASHSRAYRGEAANDAYAYAGPQADAVVVGGKVIGADPDVFIREQLLREGDQSQLNGN